MITHLILQPMTACYVFRSWNKANGPLIKQHEIYICVTGSSTYTSVCHALQTRHDLGGPRLSSDIPSIFTTATVSLPSYLITPAAHCQNDNYRRCGTGKLNNIGPVSTWIGDHLGTPGAVDKARFTYELVCSMGCSPLGRSTKRS